MPPKKPNRWSTKVTRESHVLDLEKDIFTWNNPCLIACSLKKSAEKSKDSKTAPYSSAWPF